MQPPPVIHPPINVPAKNVCNQHIIIQCGRCCCLTLTNQVNAFVLSHSLTHTDKQTNDEKPPIFFFPFDDSVFRLLKSPEKVKSQHTGSRMLPGFAPSRSHTAAKQISTFKRARFCLQPKRNPINQSAAF